MRSSVLAMSILVVGFERMAVSPLYDIGGEVLCNSLQIDPRQGCAMWLHRGKCCNAGWLGYRFASLLYALYSR